MKPSIMIHGGAGSGKYPRTDRRFKELRDSLEEGLAAMKKGSSLDGVEAAVRCMESSGAFNAGRGACLTADGMVQLDAAVMTGEGSKGAGVGAVTCTYNPVTLARWVMKNTEHVLVVGEACGALAKAAGIRVTEVAPSARSLRSYDRLRKASPPSPNLELWKRIQRGNTIGAVAVDSAGIPSAAVSTGGVWLKLPGRVGDSAILGAGVYANARLGAACATGMGEEIIRTALSWNACNFLKKSDASMAAKKAIGMITRSSGINTAGIIVVDTKGRIGCDYNTEAMGRAWYDYERGRAVVTV